mmetsp:Transcript_28420/g.64588  ORF Transcript_28420/g.64588 Transcript_28420/m.64588 type:complete len:200 (+) Transcript_28420:505-1104(+)
MVAHDAGVFSMGERLLLGHCGDCPSVVRGHGYVFLGFWSYFCGAGRSDPGRHPVCYSGKPGPWEHGVEQCPRIPDPEYLYWSGATLVCCLSCLCQGCGPYQCQGRSGLWSDYVRPALFFHGGYAGRCRCEPSAQGPHCQDPGPRLLFYVHRLHSGLPPALRRVRRQRCGPYRFQQLRARAGERHGQAQPQQVIAYEGDH